MRCAPWHHGGKAVLLGDAAHAIVPFFGQGMNAAFEDCIALDACLARQGGDLGAAFASYFLERKENADAIAEMALENFIEMRDKTASRLFRARKHVEKSLNKWFPESFKPLYNMISFSTIPYAEARRRARMQARITMLGAVTALLVILLLVMTALMIRR
jgi:kynurenine 3-monooxygenase